MNPAINATNLCSKGHLYEDEDTQVPLPFDNALSVERVCGICERTAAILLKSAQTVALRRGVGEPFAVPVSNLDELGRCPREGCNCQIVLTGDRDDPIRGLACGYRPLSVLSDA